MAKNVKKNFNKLQSQFITEITQSKIFSTGIWITLVSIANIYLIC